MSGSTELAQATSALAEARAKCDELRDALANTQSTLDEALRVQGTIWDAVGGQRDGESLLDAVRRVVGERDAGFVEGLRRATAIVRERCGGSREADLVNAFDRAAHQLGGSVNPAMTIAEVEQFAEHEQLRGAEVRELREEIERLRAVAFERAARPDAEPRAEVSASAQYASFVTEADRAAPTAVHPIADAIGGLALDEIAALSAAGWVMRWTAPSMRWVTPGGAALDPATWRETLRREAARLLGRRYVPEGAGAQSEEAKMGEFVGSAAVEAERLRLERSIDTLNLPCIVQVSTSEIQRMLDAAREAGRAEAKMGETMRMNPLAVAAVEGPNGVAQVSAREIQRVIDEAREAGRAEMRAERDAMQVQLDDARKALGAQANESLFGAAVRVSSDLTATRAERDAAYRRGQEAIRAHAAVALDARGACSCAELVRSIPIAKTPTVSASEVTGEAIPGWRAAETAGAGESVARSVDLATIWKGRAGGYRTKALNEADANKRGYHDGVADAYATCADEIGFVCGKLREELAGARVEIDRLNRCLCDSMEQLAEESERWRAATGCESPAKASAFVARINEAAKLLRD